MKRILLAESVTDRVTGLYAMGDKPRKISNQMEEYLGYRVSADTICIFTDRVLSEIKDGKFSGCLIQSIPIV